MQFSLRLPSKCGGCGLPVPAAAASPFGRDGVRGRWLSARTGFPSMRIDATRRGMSLRPPRAASRHDSRALRPGCCQVAPRSLGRSAETACRRVRYAPTAWRSATWRTVPWGGASSPPAGAALRSGGTSTRCSAFGTGLPRSTPYCYGNAKLPRRARLAPDFRGAPRQRRLAGATNKRGAHYTRHQRFTSTIFLAAPAAKGSATDLAARHYRNPPPRATVPRRCCKRPGTGPGMTCCPKLALQSLNKQLCCTTMPCRTRLQKGRSAWRTILSRRASTAKSRKRPQRCLRQWASRSPMRCASYLPAFAREKALPFAPLVPNDETIAAMKEARAGDLPAVQRR